MTESEIGWVAGFFDGEGSVVIKRPSKSQPRYGMGVRISQTDIRPLLAIQRWFGGHIRQHRPARGRHDACFIIDMAGKTAGKFLVSVRPHLRVKDVQADIAIAFNQTILSTRNTGRFGDRHISTEVHQYRSALYEAMKIANLKGPKADRPSPIPIPRQAPSQLQLIKSQVEN